MSEEQLLFEKLPLPGAFLAQTQKRGDERGFFSRMYCAREFARRGLPQQLAQINTSFSRQKGTLRGLHYQLPPREETKIVAPLRGAIWDVVLDLRPGSPTFGKHAAAELRAGDGKMMCAPKGCAHGFLTLAADTEIIYLTDEFYAPECERGVRWDDPAFAIPWPAPPALISPRDRSFPDYSPDNNVPAN